MFANKLLEITPSFAKEESRKCCKRTSLLAARRRAGVSTRSEVKILKAVAGCYTAQVGDGLWMKIGNDSWAPKEAVELAASGPGYAVWLEATPQAP